MPTRASRVLARLFHTRNDNRRHSVCWSRSRFGKLKVPSGSRDAPAAVDERTTARAPWLHEIFALAVISAAGFFSCGFLTAGEPTNLSLCKQEVIAYVKRGEYAQQIAAVAHAADQYLQRRIAQGAKPGEKLAIVFDIDETMLSSLGEIEANDYGYVPTAWKQWVAEGRAPAILPVQSIYDTALRGKIDIFIITGRNEGDRPGTERNLRQVGYKNWTRMIFRTAETQASLDNAEFKTGVRRKITEEGYTIVANIGDQASDLTNGYAERTFKLPNPFYLAK